MDRDLARMVAGNAIIAARQLGDLALLIKDRCDDKEREVLKLAIGSAVYAAMELQKRVFELSPGLREEFEQRLAKYDRTY